jgi:hypothetical protein
MVLSRGEFQQVFPSLDSVPLTDTSESSAALVRASGMCAECHITQHYSIIHEYELSAHAA